MVASGAVATAKATPGACGAGRRPAAKEKPLDGAAAVGQKVRLGIFANRGTASMAAALLSPRRIKRNRRQLRWRTSGRTVYAYVGGNPVMWVDPEGLQFFPYSRNLNTRSTSGQRLPDGVAMRLNVYWGGATAGAAVGIAGPYVIAGGVSLTPEALAAAVSAAKKSADVCKTKEFQEGVLRACLAVGVCSKDKPDQWVSDLERLQRMVEGSVREAQQRGTIIFPRPPGP